MTLDTAKRHIQDAIESMQAALADIGGIPTGPVDKITHVPKGGNLQAAVDAAVPGEVVRVFPGEYPQLTLKPKPPGAAVVITPDTTTIPPGQRIDPSYKPGLITIRANDAGAPVRTVGAASNYLLRGFNPLYSLDGGRIYAQLGDHEALESDPLTLPDNIVLDQCLLQGDPDTGAKCGIQMHTRTMSVLNSHLSDFFRIGQDAQCLAGYNGPGPFALINNYCAAAGENILLGGADNRSAAMNPTQLLVRGNTLTKPIAWQTRPFPSPGITVKNGFELKNCVKAIIEYNLIENCWSAGQTGWLVLFTVRNQDGRNPWTQVADVLFQHNVVRNGSGGIKMIGRDDLQPSARTVNVKILNNLFYNIDRHKFPGDGRFLAVYHGVKDVEIAHNTCLSTPDGLNAFMGVDAFANTVNQPEKNDHLTVRDCVFMEGEYGLHASGRAPGKDAWDTMCVESSFERNLIAIGNYGRNITYPGVQNYKGTVPGEVPCGPDFKLLPKYAALASSDGQPLGADIQKIRDGVSF